MMQQTKENWIVTGKTGISSKAIYSHFIFGEAHGGSNPRDPSDFLRCYWLLKLAPEWRKRIVEMARYAGWERIALAWDELEAMLLQDAPQACSSGEYTAETSPLIYERMQELRKEAR